MCSTRSDPVSIATAWAMARGALVKSRADIAVSITGIAGPGGGSEMKPVGTVVFARAEKGNDSENVVADLRRFPDEGRASIRLQAALCALELLLPEADERGIKLGRACLEGARHLPERAIEHLPGQHLEQPVLEGEIDAEMDEATALSVILEAPVIAADASAARRHSRHGHDPAVP